MAELGFADSVVFVFVVVVLDVVKDVCTMENCVIHFILDHLLIKEVAQFCFNKRSTKNLINCWSFIRVLVEHDSE